MSRTRRFSMSNSFPIFSLLSLVSASGVARSRFGGPLFDPDAPGGGSGTPGDTPPNPNGNNPDDPLSKAQAELAQAKAKLAALEGEVTAANSRIAELGKKAEAAELSAAERAELAALKKSREEAEAKRLREEGQFETLLRKQADEHAAVQRTLQEQIAAKDAALANERKMSKLLSLIPKHTGADPADVINALFRDTISVDADGKFVLKGKDGQPPRNPTTQLPMSVEEFVAFEIESRPYFKAVRPLGGAGSSPGSSGSAPGGGYTSEDIAKMSPAEYKKNRDKILAQVKA